MNLQDSLERDLAEAMKLRDQFRIDVLRLVKSALKNHQIEVGHELSMAEAISILQKEAKKRGDAATTYAAAGREEMADQEKKEQELIASYLPEQMGDAELKAIIETAIADSGATTMADMGKVMAVVMPQVGAKAEGARVSAIAKELLAQS